MDYFFKDFVDSVDRWICCSFVTVPNAFCFCNCP